MKRFLIPILAVVLVLAFAGAASAAPVQTPEAGQFTIFGGYNYWFTCFNFGGGYALTDNFSIGAVYYLPGYVGVSGSLNLKPFLFNAEVLINHYNLTFLSAMYAIDLDPILLAFGGGAEFTPWGNLFYIEGAANIALGDCIGLYGSFSYFPAYTDHSFEAGLSLSF